MSAKKKNKKISEWSYYVCETCNSKSGFSEMTFEEMKTHLQTVHKIDTSNTLMTSELVSHIDEEKYFQSLYKLKIGKGIEVSHSIRRKRRGEDKRLWSGH